LEELQRYERLVRKVAEQQWRAANPDRKSVPPQLADEFNLSIVAVEDGSAMPVLERDSISQSEWDPYLTDATVLIEQAFQALIQGKSLPSGFDWLMSQDFRDFGASLQGGEAIEFRPTSAYPIVYSAEVRDEVRERLGTPVVGRLENVTRRGAIAGRLVRLDADAKTFKFRRLGDPASKGINGKYSQPGLTADLRRILESNSVAPVVRVTGDLIGPPDAPPIRIGSVASVELFEVDGMSSSARLIELAALEPGWNEGHGMPVEFAALDAARDILLQLHQDSLAMPSVFPLEDGGVQLEWASPELVSSIEISPDVNFSLFRLVVGTRQSESQDTDQMPEAIDFARQVSSEF
jgi:hypothetical protein